MAQLECDQVNMPAAEAANVFPMTATVPVNGVGPVGFITGYSPNKASAALALSSLFHHRMATPAMISAAKSSTGIITPLDMTIGASTAVATETTSRKMVEPSCTGGLVHQIAPVTAPDVRPAKKTRVTMSLPPSNLSQLPHFSQTQPKTLSTEGTVKAPEPDCAKDPSPRQEIDCNSDEKVETGETTLGNDNQIQEGITGSTISVEDHSPCAHKENLAATTNGATQPMIFVTSNPQGRISYYAAVALDPTEHPELFLSQQAQTPIGFRVTPSAGVTVVPMSSTPATMQPSRTQSIQEEHKRPYTQPHLASPFTGMLSMNSAPYSPPEVTQAVSTGGPIAPIHYHKAALASNAGHHMIPNSFYYFNGHSMNHPVPHASDPHWVHHNNPSSAFHIPASLHVDPMQVRGHPLRDGKYSMNASMNVQTFNHTMTIKTDTATKSDLPLEFQKHNSYSRKEKSLGVLSEHFISLYTSLQSTHALDDEIPNITITIDQAAAHLAIERRRIYDIVNVLESLKIVTRKCKNTYLWHGTNNLSETLADLQEQALFGLATPMNTSKTSNDDSTISTKNESDSSFYGFEEAMKSGLLSSDDDIVAIKSLYANDKTLPSRIRIANKTKTLAKLTQRFMQYFLIGHLEISLIDSSERILGKSVDAHDNDSDEEGCDLKVLKSRLRRLYDVANVLTSLKIIEKKNSGNCFKSVECFRPSFKWCWQLTPSEILQRRISRKMQRNYTSLNPV